MINLSRSLFLAPLLIFGCLAASRAQDVSISSGTFPSLHGWNSGSLELKFHNSSGQSQSVRVTFSGEPLSNLNLLQVQAGDWQLDLSRYVVNLPMAFPHRITISTELEDDGKFHELVLDLPYWRQVPGPCMVLELSISEGRVVDDVSFEILSERCAQ